MALIQCPDCGKRISSYAESCPDCGYPIAKRVTEIAISQQENQFEQSNIDKENVERNIVSHNGQKTTNDSNPYRTSSNRNEQIKTPAPKSKKWMIPIIIVAILLVGLITYSVKSSDAERKKGEARQLFRQNKYLELMWKINEIPELFYDDECLGLDYAGSIGSTYSIAEKYSSDTGLGYLITGVWSASADTWYDSPNDDLSLTEEMMVIQKAVMQAYYSVLQNDYGLTEQQIDQAIEIGNNATNETRGDAFDEYVATLINSTKDKTEANPATDAFVEYVSTNNITLDNYDVQYNMANNLDKEFTLIGYAELDDYYNYGFDDDMEPSYYCLKVTPADGKYSNIWYIYCHRSSLQGLFDKVQSAGEKYVKMICYIPEWRFEKGQNNMAMLKFVVY